MIKRLAALYVCIIFVVSCEEQPTTPTGTGGPRYQAGQVWTYHTRPGEEASRLVLLKVDPHETLGHIIHVRVEGVSFAVANAPSLETGVIPFLPFTEEAINRSVINLITSRPELPDFTDEYERWSQAALDDSHPPPTINIPIIEKINEIEKLHAK